VRVSPQPRPRKSGAPVPDAGRVLKRPSETYARQQQEEHRASGVVRQRGLYTLFRPSSIQRVAAGESRSRSGRLTRPFAPIQIPAIRIPPVEIPCSRVAAIKLLLPHG